MSKNRRPEILAYYFPNWDKVYPLRHDFHDFEKVYVDA